MALAAPLPSGDVLFDQIHRRSVGLKFEDIDAHLSDLAREQEEEGNAKLAIEFRKQCESLIGFTEYRYARYRAAPHHKFVAEQLERGVVSIPRVAEQLFFEGLRLAPELFTSSVGPVLDRQRPVAVALGARAARAPG